MARTTPPTITPAPLPAPQRGDRATFSARVDAFVLWLTTAVAQFGAVATNVYNNALDAFASATSAGNSATAAGVSATNAARDAASAVGAPGTNATSVTSNTIGVGSKSFVLAQTGKLFALNQTVLLSSSTPGSWMAGTVSAFDSGTGAMTVNVTNFNGSGTFTSWVISLSGPVGIIGVVNELRANNIASAATVNLTTATGNLVHITGTTTITAFTLQAGAERQVISDGTFTIVNSATLLVPGRADIIVRPGDAFTVRGDTGLTQITNFERANGLAVKSGAFDLLASAEITTAVSNIDYLNIFTSDYDNYRIELQGVRSSANGSAFGANFAVAGVVDMGSNYSSGSALSLGGSLSSTAEGANISIVVKNVNSSFIKSLEFSNAGRNGSNVFTPTSGQGAYYPTNPISGIRIYGGTSITQGSIRIYGIKNNF